jgi:hypothetical protein
VAGIQNYDSKRFLIISSKANIIKCCAIVYLSITIIDWWALLPKGTETLRHEIFPSLTSVPGQVDAVVITVPAACFREIGEEGIILEDLI